MPQPYYHSHQIMAWQEEVDAPRLGVLAVWEVPPLVPRDSKPVPPLHSLGTPEYLVSAELPLQNGCIPDIFRAILPFQLHERSSAPSSPGLYIFGHDEADKSCKYAKYRLHPTTQHPHLGSSFCIPAFSHSHTSPIPSWTPDMDLRLVPLANGQNAVITSLGSDDAIVNAFLLPSGTAGTECSSFGSIWKRRLLPDIFFTSHLPVLDPVSGRVCAPITGTQIQIMDYVMPRM